MAAGDYVVRRNNANTDTIPDSGSSLDILWDTSVASSGSSITYSSGVFTLGETGKYLVLYADQYGTTSTTNNERLNVRHRLNLGGATGNNGRSSGYIRKDGSSQEYINSGAAIIEVTSLVGNANDLKIVADRVDNTAVAGEEPDRIADRSGITIIKLDDTWNYGRYTTNSGTTPSSTDDAAVKVTAWTNVEEDSPFTRTSGDIDMATTNLVLAVYTLPMVDSSGRAEFQSRLTLNGTPIEGSWDQTYIRVTDGCTDGCLGGAVLIYGITSGDDLALEVVTRESGVNANIPAPAQLHLVELPSGAEACVVEATTGDFNASATNFAWDTNPYIDTAAFTHTTGNANIDVDSAGDYLCMAGQAITSNAGGGGTRGVPALQFRVNSTDDEAAGGSTYNRGSGGGGGTADHGGQRAAGLLTGLAANDSIYVRNDRLGTVTTAHTCESGAFAVISMSSLFDTGGTINEKTLSDSLAVTDTDKDRRNRERELAEAIDLAESIIREYQRRRELADSLEATDAIDHYQVKMRHFGTLGNSAEVIDSLLADRHRERLLTDTLSAVDFLIREKLSQRTLLDTVELNDLIDHHILKPRVATEDAEVTDAIDHYQVKLRQFGTLGNNAPTVDQVNIARERHRLLSEGITATDTLIPLRDRYRTLSESVDIGDLIISERLRFRILADSANVTDALVAEYLIRRTLADDVSVIDASLIWRLRQRLLADSLAVTDTAIADYIPGDVTIIDKTLTDTLASTDALVREYLWRKSLADSAEVTDALIAEYQWRKSLFDDLAVSDSLLAQRFRERLLADSAAVTDDAIATYIPGEAGQIFDKTLLDSASLADAILALRQFRRLLTDTATATDSIHRAQIRLRTVADSLGLADSAVVSRHRWETLTDYADLVDSAFAERLREREIGDYAALTDAIIARFIRAGVFILDTLAVTDAALSTLIRAYADESNQIIDIKTLDVDTGIARPFYLTGIQSDA